MKPSFGDPVSWMESGSFVDTNIFVSVSDSDKNGTKSVEKNSATGGATAAQWWIQIVLCA